MSGNPYKPGTPRHDAWEKGCNGHPHTKPRPLEEWHEGLGDVLWWKFPVNEPPYVGTPNDLGHTVELYARTHGHADRYIGHTMVGGWTGYHTH